MSDGRTSLAGDFKAGKGGEQGVVSNKTDEKTLTHPGEMSDKDKVGVVTGLSDLSTINPEDSEPSYDYATDPLTGNAVERRKPQRVDQTTCSSKGKSFEIW